MTSISPEITQNQNSSPSPELNSSSVDKKHTAKLSTSSPEAIRVASAITANRLANLLIRKGPLAIRLITAQLSIEVPGFELLSLSKQRRLIMAAMEQGDPENNVVFEKIGWGQWAVRHVDSDYIVTEPNGSLSGNSRMNIHELREKAKLGWSKKAEFASEEGAARNTSQTKPTIRRDSISNNKPNMHNIRVPGEKLESPSGGISDSEQDSDDDDDDNDNETRGMDRSPQGLDEISHMRDLKMKYLNGDDDNAIDEDSEEDGMDEDESLFKFEDDEQGIAAAPKYKRSPALKFANRVPTKFSPPPALSGGNGAGGAGGRRKSSSAAAAPNSIVKNTSLHNRHQLFNRSRLNSIENLDEYILSSARNSSLSVSSPNVQNSSLPSTSPLGSWNGKGEFLNQSEFPLPADQIAAALHNAGRRKSSFNESSIRSTLSSSLPRGHSLVQRPYENMHSSVSSSAVAGSSIRKATAPQEIASDTDEEDWATMGAETLRSHSSGMSSPAGKKLKNEERTAARALVDLMGN